VPSDRKPTPYKRSTNYLEQAAQAVGQHEHLTEALRDKLEAAGYHVTEPTPDSMVVSIPGGGSPGPTVAKVVRDWELRVPSAQAAFAIQRRWHLKALATWERIARSHMSTAALYLRRSHEQATTVMQCSMRELAFTEGLYATRAFRRYREHSLQLSVLLKAERVAQEVSCG